MADSLRDVGRGENLLPRLKSADWHNRVNAATRAVEGGNVNFANETVSKLTGTQWITVDITNKSGSAITRPGGALKLDGLYYTLVDKPRQVFGKPFFKGSLPTSAADDFVIIPTPRKTDQPGVGVVSGFVFCRVSYTDTNKKHTKAAPKPSTVAFLESGPTGVPIFWREKESQTGAATTGEQWALVLMGNGIAVYEVAITATIPAATWDKVAKKRTSQQVESPYFFPHTSGDGTDTYDVAKTIKYRVPYASEVTVSSGKFRIGTVVNGVLVSVDCTELDQP